MAKNSNSANMNRQIRLNNSLGNTILKIGIVLAGIILSTALFWQWIGMQFGPEYQVPSLLLITHIGAFVAGMIVRGEVDLAPIKTILNTSMQAQKQGAHAGSMEGRMLQREAAKDRDHALKDRAKAETALRDAERVRHETEKIMSEQGKRGRRRPKRIAASHDMGV